MIGGDILMIWIANVGVICLAIYNLIINAFKAHNISKHIISVESRLSEKAGKKQAIEAISNLVNIPVLRESGGGTIVRDWFVILYRIEKNKITNLPKQEIALELISKKERKSARNKLSAGSTVPAECLWLIFDNICDKRSKRVLWNVVLTISLFFYIEFLIITRLI